MSRVRLGVALLLPLAVAGEIDGLRRALGAPALGRIAPHITLVPPVNVAEDCLPDALAVLRAGAAATAVFTLELGPPATFLPVSAVLYLAVRDGTAVAALRERVFRDPLARRIDRAFHPHLTITDDAPADRIAAALAALADYRATVTFDRVHLLREGPGRVWSAIAEAAFAAPAVIGRGGLEVELSVTERADPEAAVLLGVGARPMVVTARRGGRVVGVARGRTWGEEGELDALVVDAEVRRQGVGSNLMAALESLAVERDCRLLRTRLQGDTLAVFLRARGWSDLADHEGRSALGRHLG